MRIKKTDRTYKVHFCRSQLSSRGPTGVKASGRSLITAVGPCYNKNAILPRIARKEPLFLGPSTYKIPAPLPAYVRIA